MIAVIGDVMLDKYIYGSSTRMSPECSSAPVVKQYATEDCIGGAGNTALNIKNLNADVKLFCALNNSSGIKKLLQEKNVDYEETVNANFDVIKTRIVSNGEYIARLDYDYNINCDETNLVKLLFDNSPNLIVISDYNKGTIQNPKNIIKKEIIFQESLLNLTLKEVNQ